MARIDSIFKSAGQTQKTEQHPKRITKWIHYTKLKDNKNQYCDEASPEEIEALADLIEADGEVLQDLLVRKTDTDEYEIVAGHKRRRACRLLVEERGRKEFEFLPCYIKNESDVRSEFHLYSTNGYHEKTDYERMHELERMEYLLKNFPEEFPQVQTGRMVERLAKLLNMKKTTVGEYLTIAKNLSEKGMVKFKMGDLKKSAAVELAGLPEEKQDELIGQGIIRHADIKKVKQEEKLVKPDETAYQYFNKAARHLLLSHWNWFKEDYTNRVELVDKSPVELKQHLGKDNRTWWFSAQKGTSHINLFDDYVQMWDEDGNCLGNYDWFYLAAALQRTWNDVSLEQLRAKQREEEDQAALQPIPEEQDSEEEQIPGQMEIGDMPGIYPEQEEVKPSVSKNPGREFTPELCHLKNNEQRKEWLRNYRDWGIWYTDSHIGCTYYKYDFKNGARLIVETYHVPATKWIDEHDAYYLHLVGGPEPPQTGKYNIGKWIRHEQYDKHPDSEMELVEFIKFVQRGE